MIQDLIINQLCLAGIEKGRLLSRKYSVGATDGKESYFTILNHKEAYKPEKIAELRRGNEEA